MSTLLGMFAKFWQPGQVKSRLAARIGNERAAGVQRLFVETLIRRFASVAQKRVLCYSPSDRHEEFRRAAGNRWQVEAQVSGNLGQRMETFFARSLQQAERVVLIGSDSPDLPREFVDQAFAALADCDVVLGPAEDGGYYLVGAARRVPAIFEGIGWSTSRVWDQSVERLRAAGTSWHALPEWYDVDDLAGLKALSLRLGSRARSDEEMASLLGNLCVLLVDLPKD